MHTVTVIVNVAEEYADQVRQAFQNNEDFDLVWDYENSVPVTVVKVGSLPDENVELNSVLEIIHDAR